MHPKAKRALKVALLILFVFRPGLGSLITWFDCDREGTKHGLVYSGFRFDVRGAFDSDYWQHFPPAKLLCLIDMPASLFSDTIALPVTAVVEFRRSRRADGQEKPNHPASGKAGIARRLTIDHHWPGLPEPGRWATVCAP
jgi:uncharacterized protein YceK